MDQSYDNETVFYIQAPVESFEALDNMLSNTMSARNALLQAVSPRAAKLGTLPYNAPQAVFQYTDDYDDDDDYSDTPMAERPLYIVIKGQDGYDGPGPRMADFSAPTRSLENIRLVIEAFMNWLRQDTQVGYFQDDRGLYGPVDGWVGRDVDKYALSISSEIYAFLTPEQKRELRGFGYNSVHIQVTPTSGDSEIVNIYVNPSDQNDADEMTRWRERLWRRNLPRYTPVPFVFQDAYDQSLPRLVHNAFRRIV
jgi:hypothetical protein